jgi:UDP-N-acetylglucosamine 1-carboxyvinyltransferase
MAKLTIEGGHQLSGEIKISGAKNSAVALLPAAVLAHGKSTIYNVPEISDIEYLIDIMNLLNCKVTHKKDALIIDTSELQNKPIPEELSVQMRASYYFMGALLAKFGRVEMSFPGGCNIGARPIDIHIKGFEELGAHVEIIKNRYIITANKLVGKRIYFDFPSVGATINIMLAAVCAKGITTIENAAKEPHVVDVANFLNVMGANIKGAGTDRIKIKGVLSLKGNVAHSIIPDMIEAGTYMLASAITNGDVVVKNIIPKHLEPLTAKLTEMNVIVEEGEDFIRVKGNEDINPVNIKTSPYPGFPTDLHPQMSVFLTRGNGVSKITEGIWELRFQYVDELKKMGAHIKLENRTAVIEGVCSLKGAKVVASDLRAGAALVLAGLAASGETQVYNTHYIDRGYEKLEEKLTKLGAKIRRERD